MIGEPLVLVGSRRGRPAGTLGEVAEALRDAARDGPAPVRVLCERAQVGYAAGRYTASRLVDRGHLVVCEEGRPAVLGLPDLEAPGHAADAQPGAWERCNSVFALGAAMHFR